MAVAGGVTAAPAPRGSSPTGSGPTGSGPTGSGPTPAQTVPFVSPLRGGSAVAVAPDLGSSDLGSPGLDSSDLGSPEIRPAEPMPTYQEPPGIGISPVQLPIELDDLSPPHDVGIQEVHPARQGVHRADDPPEAVGALDAVGQGRRGGGTTRPVACRLGPAGVAHLVEEDQGDPLRHRGRFMQTCAKIFEFRYVFGIGAVVLHHPRPQPDAEPLLQGSPDPAEGQVAEDVEGGADGPQGPSAGRRAGIGDGHLLAGLFAGALAEPFQERFGVVKETSRASRPGDGRSTPPPPPTGSDPTTHTRYRDRVASRARGWPQNGGIGRQQS